MYNYASGQRVFSRSSCTEPRDPAEDADAGRERASSPHGPLRLGASGVTERHFGRAIGAGGGASLGNPYRHGGLELEEPTMAAMFFIGLAASNPASRAAAQALAQRNNWGPLEIPSCLHREMRRDDPHKSPCIRHRRDTHSGRVVLRRHRKNVHRTVQTLARLSVNAREALAGPHNSFVSRRSRPNAVGGPVPAARPAQRANGQRSTGDVRQNTYRASTRPGRPAPAGAAGRGCELSRPAIEVSRP